MILVERVNVGSLPTDVSFRVFEVDGLPWLDRPRSSFFPPIHIRIGKAILKRCGYRASEFDDIKGLRGLMQLSINKNAVRAVRLDSPKLN